MMSVKKIQALFTFLTVLTFTTFMQGGCGDGGSSGGGGVVPESTCVDISGTWDTLQAVTETSCGRDVGTFWYESVSIVQDGCEFTLTDSYGDTYQGTVDDSQISLTITEDGGEWMEIYDLFLEGDCFQGTISWTEPDCTGTSEITVSPAAVSADRDLSTADLVGSWSGVTSEGFPITLTIEDLDGQANVMEFKYKILIDGIPGLISIGNTISNLHEEVVYGTFDLGSSSDFFGHITGDFISTCWLRGSIYLEYQELFIGPITPPVGIGQATFYAVKD